MFRRGHLIDALVLRQVTAGFDYDWPCSPALADTNCDLDLSALDNLAILWALADLPLAQELDCLPVGSPKDPPLTSAMLITTALEAQTITYEESLLFRAHAVFDSAELPEEFRSETPDIADLGELLAEIADPAHAISQDTMNALAPWLVLPNESKSVFATDANTLHDANELNDANVWSSFSAAGGKVRIWLRPGTDDAISSSLIGDIDLIWAALGAVFVVPKPDSGQPAPANPDSAIDLFFFDPASLDGRWAACAQAGGSGSCLDSTPSYSVAPREPFGPGASASGFATIGLRDNTQIKRDIAMALTEISAFQFDRQEQRWLRKATAKWGGFRIFQTLGLERKYFYTWAVDQFTRPEVSVLRGDGSETWLYLYYLSQELGDAGVQSVWQVAATPGGNGIEALDATFPFEAYLPGFALRLWNKQPPLLDTFRDGDAAFPMNGLFHARYRNVVVAAPALTSFNPNLSPIASEFRRFVFPNDSVRKVIITNGMSGQEGAELQALKKIDGVWSSPEYWTNRPSVSLCRDLPTEDIEELILITTNSQDDAVLTAGSPIVVDSKASGCPGWSGTMSVTVEWDNGTYIGSENHLFTGNWSSAAESYICPDTPDCVQFNPEGTISVSRTAAVFEPATTCSESYTNTLPAVQSDPFQEIYFALKFEPAENGQLRYWGQGNINDNVRQSCPHTGGSYYVHPYFFYIQKDYVPGVLDQRLCWAHEWFIPEDATSIDGFCYGADYGYYSVRYEWHLVYVDSP